MTTEFLRDAVGRAITRYQEELLRLLRDKLAYSTKEHARLHFILDHLHAGRFKYSWLFSGAGP